VLLRFLRRLSVIVLLGLLIGPGQAQDTQQRRGRGPDIGRRTEERKTDEKADERKAADLKESISETQHEITINGRKLSYQALAGNLLLRDDDGKPTASVFFVAYNLLSPVSPGAEAGKPDPARPVTYCFNGGPGSSAVWLHLGAFGPKRVALNDSGEAPPPPYRLVDNEFTLLDLTDLVFIDPVSTGYSRAVPGVDPKRFHGVQEDIAEVGEFIRLYTTRYGRWASPKFVAGESYGTTRAAGLSSYLQERHGLNLNGIALISSVLNFQTIRFDEGNDLPYPLYLPSYTATAWYHKKLPPDLQGGELSKALAESERFARGNYTRALVEGDRLPEARRNDVARQLARLTGLSEEYVKRSNLRIEIQRFTKELLRDRERTVGRYDSRLAGTDLDAAGDRSDYDPSYAAVQGAYTATLNQYLRNDLKVVNDIPYEILTGRVQPWDYGTARNRYLNVAPSLRSAMTKNRDLRLFVACGYYDLATPFAAADYTLAHLGLDASVRNNVTAAYYEAGHMMYIHRASHEKLRCDLAAFLRGERHGGEAGAAR
jgi:carboxypeptidase C (cathepsin A)